MFSFNNIHNGYTCVVLSVLMGQIQVLYFFFNTCLERVWFLILFSNVLVGIIISHLSRAAIFPKPNTYHCYADDTHYFLFPPSTSKAERRYQTTFSEISSALLKTCHLKLNFNKKMIYAGPVNHYQHNQTLTFTHNREF